MTRHYTANGTGRDGYITINDGGFHFNYNSAGSNRSFLKSLRAYETNTYAERPTQFFKQRNHCVSAGGKKLRILTQPWYTEKVR
jgi:hypothetical protein